MDKDYIGNNTIWHENHITTSVLNYPDGYYQYFFDKNENTFYFHISYSIQSLSNHDEISVSFSNSNELNFYKITFSKNKNIYSSANTEKSFRLLSSFSDVVGSGQDIFFGIEFLNKDDRKLQNNISISINVNNDLYKITDNIVLEFNNHDNTTNSTTKKNNTTTNKANNNNSNGIKPSRENQDTDKTTKFHYNGENNNNFNPENVQENNQDNNYKYDYNSNNIYGNDGDNGDNSNFFYNNNGQIVIPEKEMKSTLSPISKILITASVILCASGIGLIAHYIIKSKSRKNSNKNNDNETENMKKEEVDE